MLFFKVLAAMAFVVLLSIEAQLRKIAEYFEKRTELSDTAIKIAKELNKEFGKEKSNEKDL